MAHIMSGHVISTQPLEDMQRMIRPALIIFLLVLSVQTAQALEPPPPGTAYGNIHIRVTDCATGEPIAGASVSIENPGHTFSTTTNMTGYAILEGYNWYYRYYVTASGYRIESGERRFYLETVFNVCMFRETVGFWRVVATVTSWQGDTHAGGEGWAVIRLKNLEPGVFDIYNMEIWVSGFEGPVARAEYSRPERLGRLVEKEFNITVAPPSNSPIGRLAAELRIKAVFTYDDGRKIGPLTIPVSMDYVQILPYRSFRLKLLDFWGFNPVPRALVIMETTASGSWSQHIANADDEGYVSFYRLREGAYYMGIYYTSPYDGETHLVKASFPILGDLVNAGKVNTWLYEARVDIVDIAGRPLDTTVYLGRVAVDSLNGVAYYRNVPRGEYNVKALWNGREVFNGSIKVEEPLARPSPGGILKAVADVGDLILAPRDKAGEKLVDNVTLRLEPLGITIRGGEMITFPQLPRGEYTVKASFYNNLLGYEAPVGLFKFRIPEDHGTHELRMEIYDILIRFQDSVGRPAEVNATLGSAIFKAINGSVLLDDITSGDYTVTAKWMGVTVFEGILKLPDEDRVVVSVYPLTIKVKTLEGERLVRGLAYIEIDGSMIDSEISDGSAYFPALPAGVYHLSILMDGQTVYNGGILVGGGDAEIVAEAGHLRVVIRDQLGDPLISALVILEGGEAKTTDESGFVDFGQVPKGVYNYVVYYKDIQVGTGLVEAGKLSTTIIEVYPFTVHVVNQLGQPVEAEVEISSQSKLIGRAVGSSILFQDVPRGPYSVRATFASKQIEQEVTVSSSSHEITLTIPVALYLGPGMILSLSDILLIAAPITTVLIVAALILAVKKTLHKVSRKGVPRI